MKIILALIAYPLFLIRVIFLSIWMIFLYFWPVKSRKWSIFYKGLFNENDGYARLISYGLNGIKNIKFYEANSKNLWFAEDIASRKLSEKDTIIVILSEGKLKQNTDGSRYKRVVEESRRLKFCKISMGDAISGSFFGQVCIESTQDGLNVKFYEYKFGREFSIGTGETSQRIKLIKEQNYNWSPSEKTIENFVAEGASFADDYAKSVIWS